MHMYPLLPLGPASSNNLIPTMRGVAISISISISAAPVQTTTLLRPLPLLQQCRCRQLALFSASSRHPGIAKGSRGGRRFPLSGFPDAVSMALPTRAAATPSSPAAAAGPSNDEVKISTPYSVGENDLLIIGPGSLGRIVAEKWKQDHPGCQTFGQTLTTDHHDELLKLGIKPLLSGFNISRFPYVIFCAPPSRSLDYPADVRLAASNWSGEGSFLFTSSTAAYDCSDNGLCNEDSPVVPIGRSPRTDVILKAENAVLDSGGCVLRLAGLYKFDRGAHVYWLGKGIDETRPDHILNLIHYEDAASLSIAIMKKQLRSRIFMGCDNHPLSRQEIMDYVNKSERFDNVFQKFTGTDGPLGKRLNNSKTRAEIGWEPKYTSFPSFLGLTQ